MVRSVAPWIAGVFVAAAVIALIWWGITAMNAQDAQGARDEQAMFARANHVCGSPPLKIIAHGSSWSYGPWLEVRCADGTTRAVR